MSYVKKIKPSDLSTKKVRSSSGRWVTVKVVDASSETLEDDILAAFQSNVRRVRRDQRREDHVATDAA